MRNRLACCLLIVLVAAAPILRVMCDVDCLTPRAIAAPPGQAHCASHEDGSPTPAPADRCNHDHSATLTTQAATKTQINVPAQAEFAGASELFPMAILSTPARQVGVVVESPPLSHQTPLRI